MREVTLYTYSGIKSVRPSSGKAGYVLETMTGKGPATLTKTAEILNATANQSELRILLLGLGRLREKCHLTVYTESSYVAAGIEELPRWQENGWKTSRKTEIANSEEWQKVAEILNGSTISVHVGEHHEYRAWLQNEVRKE